MPSRVKLSVCCIANSRGPFLRAALAPLRDIADEVIVVAGGDVPKSDLEYYGEVADQLFAVDFRYVERHLAWLHAQCQGDWILRLDGDEIASPEMLSEVVSARDDRQVSSVSFARRSLAPTIEHYIAQEPWYPDFQLRMVRNDGSLRFSGLMHSSAERVLPARIVEAPIYHFPFILGSIEDRRARAERYEQHRPGLVAPTRLPANRALLPEELPTLLTAPVPVRHRNLLQAAISTSPPPRGLVDVVRVSLQDTDALWAGRKLHSSAYRASIAVIGTLMPLSPCERMPIYFRVHNEGTELWSWDPSVGPYLHVVHRVLDEGGSPMEDWRPSFFTEWVRPGATTVVPGHLDAPSSNGRYILEVKVRHAPERLFGDFEGTELVVREGGAWRT